MFSLFSQPLEGPDILLLSEKKNWMVPLNYEAAPLAVDQMQITLPNVVFHCDADGNAIASRFMWSVNAHCPPVSDDLYARVAQVHERWVRSLEYLRQWKGIREYLNVPLNGVRAGGAAE
ncbi:uncharacterized protein LOC129588019 [Paramacrobiotus metropolitanus]|uniref:uncharacterized protein LOC129588019 n=1 Tax=Paramacrobiotus metropolitanus TaxID=2943436 RepID=UPI00244637CC|nr:uncharacterized protein LOC129588019 [Paramacrobiotus metropolitanus]